MGTLGIGISSHLDGAILRCSQRLAIGGRCGVVVELFKGEVIDTCRIAQVEHLHLVDILLLPLDLLAGQAVVEEIGFDQHLAERLVIDVGALLDVVERVAGIVLLELTVGGEDYGVLHTLSSCHPNARQSSEAVAATCEAVEAVEDETSVSHDWNEALIESPQIATMGRRIFLDNIEVYLINN